MSIGPRVLTRSRISAIGIVILLALPAHAHNNRADLAFYGGFGPTAARCQRLISKVAEDCAATVVTARSQCMTAQIDGQSCDSAAVDAATQAARQRARDLIQGLCTEQDVKALQFSSLAEAQLDAVTACGDVETAALSATYGPVMLGGAVGSADGMVRTCVAAAGREGERLMRVATRTRRRMLDRIVANELSPSEKQQLLQRGAQRIHQAHVAAAQRLAAACAAADFAAVYGRSPDVFLESLEQRGDCVAGAAYVQAAVTCPTPVCGNGMQESGEACSPLSPEMCPGGACAEAAGQDPANSFMYTNLIYNIYNDPVVLRLDPPLDLSGSDAARSFTYCALYDNGFTDPTTVKRKSTSPLPPFAAPGFGGPCAVPTNCVAGQLRAPCSGRTQAQRNASCDSSPGAADGVCDACLLTGGVTTDDEMFVLLGAYYKP